MLHNDGYRIIPPIYKLTILQDENKLRNFEIRFVLSFIHYSVITPFPYGIAQNETHYLAYFTAV